MTRRAVLLILMLAGFMLADGYAPAFAAGEAVNGFPNWAERVLHEWTNRARVDPQYEMAECGAACGEAACYSPIAPIGWNESLNRAARFHADHMARNGYFAHNSACSLVSGISSIYPQPCDGSAACSCVNGILTGSTAWNSRVASFGKSPTAEVIVTTNDPNWGFYAWLYENSPVPTCAFSTANGHRWSILKQTGVVGAGSGVGNSVMDFGSGVTPTKIVSGIHYPRQAPTVEMWANWYDAAAPLAATVVVDGSSHVMTLARGTTLNGAWTTSVSGMGSGCHRYFFQFTDSAGTVHRYPTTGTYGIGDQTCADWSTSQSDMSVSADFDGDGRADKAIIRPTTMQWWILHSAGGYTAVNWGLPGDLAVAADYDGDLRSDIAVWRPADGSWWILRSTGGFYTTSWGVSADIPVPGDYDGDGQADIAVFRPSTGAWWIRYSSGGAVVRNWGAAQDRPVQADYDGDGTTDVAIWRPSDGSWWVTQSSGGLTRTVFGLSEDVPVPSGYDSDARTDFAIFRPSTREFWVRLSTGGVTRRTWGMPGDVPIGGEFNGDGRADYAVWRPSTRDWWVSHSNDAPPTANNWGMSGDIPITEARER